MMPAPVMREVAAPLRDYFCSYGDVQEIRKISAASSEHAARIFIRSTFTPKGALWVAVRISVGQRYRDAHKYKLAGKGVKVFARI